MDSFNINLENFQSISNAQLEFVTGINLIVGQSNSGKTAILRAINSVVSNPTRGKYFIKKGTKSSEVTIEFEGSTISWKRTPTDINYEIDGELYKKAGRNTLFDIKADNGFVQDDSGNIMNIEGEWDLPFPFDRTPSELFKLFENIFCISDSAVILKSFKDEEGNIVKEKLSLEDKLSRTTKKISGLEELQNEVNLEKYVRKLDIFRGHVTKYKNISEDIQKIYNSEKFSHINLDEVCPPKEDSIGAYVETAKDYKFLVKVLHRQKFYKSLPESLIVGETLEKYIQMSADYEHIIHAKALKSIDISKECTIDGSTLVEYLEISEDYKILQRLSRASKFDIIKECNIDNTLNEYEVLRKDLEFIQKCYKKCKELKAQYAALDTRIETAQEKLNKYKVCPLCGHELGD